MPSPSSSAFIKQDVERGPSDAGETYVEKRESPSPLSIKGRIVRLLSAAAAAGPWRSAFERTLVRLGHKYPLSRTVQSFWRYFGAELMKREGSSFSRMAVFETGGKMACGEDRSLAQLSLTYYFSGTITGQHEDEQRVVRFFRQLLKEGDVFFDLGANFGFYSCYVLPLCGKSGGVHSFEANPVLLPHLRRAAEANREYGEIHVNPVAVGGESGKILPLYGTERIGCSSLYPHDWISRESPVLVPVITIDRYVSENQVGQIDVMKIDIEGAELDALKGMEATFCTCPPKVIVCELTLLPGETDPLRHDAEISRRVSTAADAHDLSDFLKRKGYSLWLIGEDGRLRALDTAGLTADIPLKLTNVAFVRPELSQLRPEIFE